MTCYSCAHSALDHDADHGFCHAPGCGCSGYVPEELGR